MFLTTDDDILHRIDRRSLRLLRLSLLNMEPTQVLRYGPGDRYDGHHDFFPVESFRKQQYMVEMLENGRNNRLATLFWYLSDVEEGGGTFFPYGNQTRRNYSDYRDYSGGLSIPAKKGRA